MGRRVQKLGSSPRIFLFPNSFPCPCVTTVFLFDVKVKNKRMDSSQSAETLKHGVIFSPDISKPSDDFEIVEQEPRLQSVMQPISFRVLFMGNALSDRHKTSVLKKFSESIASMTHRRQFSSDDSITFHERKHHIVFLDAFEDVPIETYEDNGLSVIEADFTWSPDFARHHLLGAYIDHHWHKINLCIYFYSSHSVVQHQKVDQEMEYLKRLSVDYDIPTWPILVHRPHERPRSASSRSSRSPTPRRPDPDEVDPISLRESLSELLIKHGVKCADLIGMNPERPHFLLEQSVPQVNTKMDIMTVDQFITIDQHALGDMLKRWQAARVEKRDGPKRKSAMARKASIVVLCVVGLWLLLSNNSNRMLGGEEEQREIQLHPMWSIVNQETLRHLFVVDVPPRLHSHYQNFSVILDDDAEYPMDLDHQGRYVVDVPSPCLLHSDHDYNAKVVHYPTGSSPLLIDRVDLTLENCLPVYDNKYAYDLQTRMCSRGEGQALAVPRYPDSKDAWQLLMASLKLQLEALVAAWTAILEVFRVVLDL
ncbi:hypothetical protein BJV82DRAFT_358706 [Fennellomyces sp. T-0311]|nr:hypothetical protein BJV82DRAFT_358706 [Fennellomyces sp. T-0311]